MAPLFNIVVSRKCTADDISALRHFSCCDKTTRVHEWELNPQRYIRDLKKSDFKTDVERMILTTEQSSKIFAFAEYGYLEESSVYSVVWIARSIDCKGNSLGQSLLNIIIDEIEIDSFKNDRGDTVITQINPDNVCSKRMFGNKGFIDCGVDETDPVFHIWSMKINKHENMTVEREFVINDLLHRSSIA